jgi:hypothetical protein
LDDVGEVNGNLLFVQDGAVIVATEYFHTIFEGLDVQFLEENGLGVGNGGSSRTHLEFLDDFDLSLLDLGRNGESMEERNLRWVHTGGTWGDRHIDGGSLANSG